MNFKLEIAGISLIQIRSWFIETGFNESAEITNKMQPCDRIYYSNVYWRLNMFRAAYRSSTGALNCICV